MTPRERGRAIRHFEPADRMPYNCEGIFASALHRWVREGLPVEAIPDRHGENGEIFPGYAALNDYFGCDRGAGPALRLNLDILPAYPYEELENDGHTVLRRTGMGILVRQFVGQEDSMAHFLDHPVKTREDWRDMKSRYQPMLANRAPKLTPEFVAALNASECGVGAGVNGIFWTPRDWMGAERHMMMFYDDPDMVCDMMDTLIDLWIAVLTPVLEAGVHLDSIGISEDMAYKCGPMISPGMFREFLSPRYRRLTDFLARYGCTDICIDCDGLIDELIPPYLECGIHEFTPFEVAAGNDPYRIRREYGREVVIHGAVDKRALAAGRDAIDRELARLWPLTEGGGFLPGVDHAVPADVSFADFCYYMEQKRKYIGLA